jgi:phosphate transport system protein
MGEVANLGRMVEQATLGAVEALDQRDKQTARRIYRADENINDKRFEIENAILSTIATQQPMARDLRVLAASLEVITELERMGDYAKGIARVCIGLADEPHLISMAQLRKMADLAVDMLHRAIDALIEEDEQTARSIPDDDDAIDALFRAVQRELFKYMGEDSDATERANQLLWAAHNLERMADRVTNICERTIFITTGQLIELDVSDDEALNF